MAKKTALHDESLINDSEKLAFVLKNFADTNPLLLEQLQYQCLEKNKDDSSKEMDIYAHVKSMFAKKKEPPRITPLHLASL